MSIRNLYLIFHFFFIFNIQSCENNYKEFDDSLLKKNKQSLISQKNTDSLELFFHSKGILRFDATENNLKKSIEILNEDNSTFAVINFLADKIIIKNQVMSLSEFANNDSLRKKFQFFPKEFFPDQLVLQFEFTKIDGDIVDVFIEKGNGKIKRIKLENNLFRIESWKEHLIGCIIDFDINLNSIKKTASENALSVGYENSGEDYIFVISEIQGDWIKIECAEICGFTCASGKKYNGWVKWKEGQKILIKLLYSC
jgi:hypothetical protein